MFEEERPPVEVALEPEWKAALAPEFRKPYFHDLTDFLRREYKTQQVYPPGKQLFHAFELCPFSQVKAVIIGQDPYHGPGQAHGLCFSVQPGVKVPPSLQNIYKELAQDIPGFSAPPHGNLESWARQGVLLLNAILSVRAGQPGSHRGRGWEQFTDAVIETLARERPGVVFLLWGRFAQEKAAKADPQRHLLLKAAHPSPFSAHKGFFGCGHFSKTNQWLAQRGVEPIQWQLPQVPQAGSHN